MPNTRSLPEIVEAALSDTPGATEQLHRQCENLASAREAAELLLKKLPNQATAVEDWIDVIVELHPELAVPLGQRLRARLPPTC